MARANSQRRRGIAAATNRPSAQCLDVIEGKTCHFQKQWVFHVTKTTCCGFCTVLSFHSCTFHIGKESFLATVLRRRRFRCNRRLWRRGKWRAKRATEPRSATDRKFDRKDFFWRLALCLALCFLSFYPCFIWFDQFDLWCWFDAKICKGVKPEKDDFQIVFAAISRSMILEMFFSASLGRSEQGVWSRQDTILRGVQGSNLSIAWQGYRTDETTMKKRPSFTSFFTYLYSFTWL